MKLVSVYRVPTAVGTLYALLKERGVSINISHRKLPTRRQHGAFVRSRPYAFWYLIRDGADDVGSIYLTRQNEIGVFVFNRHHGRGYGPRAIALLMKKHPRKRYLANINPANLRSIRLFRSLGFSQIQSTYELRK